MTLSTDMPSSLRNFIAAETLEALPFCVAIYDQDGVVVAVNSGMERLLGTSRENIIGRVRLSELEGNPLYAEAVAGVRGALAGVTSSLPPFRADVRDFDSNTSHTARSVFWWDATYVPLRDASGKVQYAFVVNTDQTALMEERAAVEAARKKIDAQGETINALSSPILEVWRGVLAMPLIGHVDAERATDIASRLLEAISRTRSRFALLDLTGLQRVEAQTADSFMRIVRSIQLLGAEGILVGVQPATSRTLVELNADLRGLRTFRTLGDALEVCLQELRRAATRLTEG